MFIASDKITLLKNNNQMNLEKRLLEIYLNLQYQYKKLQIFQHQQYRPFLKIPIERSKEELQKIFLMLRKLRFFQFNISQNPSKFKQIVKSICSFVQLREFKPGDAITITGDPVKYLNFIYQGRVQIFVPANTKAFNNSIQIRNNKKKLIRQEYLKFLSDSVIFSVDAVLTTQKCYQVIKSQSYSQDLINPHISQQILEGGFLVSAESLNWKTAEFEDCIGVCLQKTLVISLRKQFASEIQLFQIDQKSRTNLKLLLKFFKNLHYDEILMYAREAIILTFEDKANIILEKDHFYLVAQGEVSVVILEQNKKQIVDELKRNIKSVKYKVLCVASYGEILGYEGLENIKYFANPKCKLLKLRNSLITHHMNIYPTFKKSIEQMISVKNKLFQSIMKNNQKVSENLKKDSLIQANYFTERRDLNDLNFLEAFKKIGQKQQQKVVVKDKMSIEASISRPKLNTICFYVNNKKSILVRNCNINNENNQKQMLQKLGILNCEQITRHNSQVIKRKIPSMDRISLPKLNSALPKMQDIPKIAYYSKLMNLDSKIKRWSQSPGQAR